MPNFLRYLRGTPWLPVAINVLGCHIGRGVYLDTTDITEFDCVRIGDYSELNAMACPQTHLFEDRVMKIDLVNIGCACLHGTTQHRSVQRGGRRWRATGCADAGHERRAYSAGSSWRGCPAAPARA